MFSETPSFTLPARQMKPQGLTYSAVFRSYDFLRKNRVQSPANPNRQAENNGAALHAGYAFADTPFSLGATYFGSYAFGLNGSNPQYNPHVDNSLPGFSESTMLEAYAKYATAGVLATLGNQIGYKPWLPASDSRLKPAAYQGLDANIKIAPGLSLGFSRFVRWEGRDQSIFDQSTLLTSHPAGNPPYPIHDTPGSSLVDLNYNPNALLSASVENYTFYDLANMIYAYGTYYPMPDARYDPFVMMEYVRERQIGAAYVGTIDNNTIGFKVGGTLAKNVTAYVAMDSSPAVYSDVQAMSASAAASGFLLPAGAAANVLGLGGGKYRVAYGGIASPYTFNLASDPLFTSSISQGMADRISAGTAVKISVTILNESKQIRGIFSQAYYDYGNAFASYKVAETDMDMTYYFRKPGIAPYRGVFVRERVADRTQPLPPYDFKYIRSQIEYDL